MNNYIVSARKYRPTNFDSVVGQKALTTTLKNAIAQGKLAHAYLFCGPRGVGKTTCARIFAKTINCLSPTPEGEACNECESCKAFNEQRSYNIHELDAASNNSVNDIRELIEQVQIPPQVGRYKVFIIDEVHMLSQAAFNAFLKTLEEPPAHAIFILATTEKQAILPTILSRCQIYDFARITVADIIDHLMHVADKEGITYEKEALHVIAEKADGGMRDALSIFDQVASFCEGNITYDKVIEDLNVLDYEEYFGMTESLLKGDIPAAMTRLNNVLCKGFEGNYFIGGLASHFRNLLMSRDEQTLPLLDVSEQVRQRYHEQAMRCKPAIIYRALKLCNDCDMHYSNARNKRLLVELTLIEVAQAAVGDDDTGCGRRPTRTLHPIFAHLQGMVSPATRATAQRTPSSATPQAAPAPAATAAVQRTTAQPAATAASAPAAEGSSHLKGLEQLLADSAKKNQRQARNLNTISIRSVTMGSPAPSNQEAQQKAAEEARRQAALRSRAEAQPAKKLCNAFDDDRLTYYWFRFAQQLPPEQRALCGRMKGMQPHVDTQTWQVNVMVENEMVEQYMYNVRVTLCNYLRTQLRNDSITLNFEIVPDNAPKRPFSRLEKFKDMMKRHPDLDLLRKELDLELA